MNTPAEAPEGSERWLEVVKSKAGAIRFGSIVVTVHEGRVTQVEAIEKTRIDPERSESRPVRKS